MLLFKRIYIGRVCPDYCVRFETVIPENEHGDMLEDIHRRAICDDAAIQIEARRGWLSWGF